MPIKTSSNNRILPANARAADVAERAVQEIMPAQQERSYAAFRVQGFQCLLYNRLTQGRKCTCQASNKILGSRLTDDGKAKPGVVNELLTGAMEFNVTPYGFDRQTTDPFENITSPHAPVNTNQGDFDVVGIEGKTLPIEISDGPQFGDNGPFDPALDIDSLASDFDPSIMGMTDAHCAVCFGQGFIGGYAPFNSNRIVLTVDDVNLQECVLDVTASPWRAEGPKFSFTTVLPFGALAIDTFRVMNNNKPVMANFTIDGQPASSVTALKFCDGRPHVVEATLPRTFQWTHVELQFLVSEKSAYFEFPKLTKGSDTAQLEQLEPFTILMSANIPNLSPQDIITETTYGKTLIVQNSNWWNTRARNVLGWECQVRVLQPQELYNILPKRGRTMTKPPATLGVRDNTTGNRRT